VCIKKQLITVRRMTQSGVDLLRPGLFLKAGIRANKFVRLYGLRLLPEFYECYNPMPYEAAPDMDVEIGGRAKSPTTWAAVSAMRRAPHEGQNPRRAIHSITPTFASSVYSSPAFLPL